MAQTKKGLGRGLAALIPTDMDFLAEVARGDFSVLAQAPNFPNTPKSVVSNDEAPSPQNSQDDVSRETSPNIAIDDAARSQVLTSTKTISGVPLEEEETESSRMEREWVYSKPLYPKIGGIDPASWADAKRDAVGAVEWVAPSEIVANPYQPRRTFDEAELNSLSNSIREHGVLQPILVRPIAMGWAFSLDGEQIPGVHYQLIAGERRWRASQMAGLQRVPVIVREVSDQQALELAIIENVQRHDISALESAQAYKRLAAEFALSQESIARRVGKSRSSIANTLRLLQLQPEAQQAIQDGVISEGHGRAILMVRSGDGARRAALRAILRGKLSVRQAEDMATRIEATTSATNDTLIPIAQDESEGHSLPEHQDVASEERLQRALSCQVQIKRRRNGGQIVLFASDDEQLERITQFLLRR